MHSSGQIQKTGLDWFEDKSNMDKFLSLKLEIGYADMTYHDPFMLHNSYFNKFGFEFILIRYSFLIDIDRWYSPGTLSW